MTNEALHVHLLSELWI